MDKRSAVISALFEKKNKRKPKNSQELQAFVKSQGGDEFLKKVDEYIAQAEEEQTKKAQKAEHGAKLQYLKSLKNKCNEDEELVYYKKGGTVDCGCKKKKGGEIKKSESGNPIERFKAKKASLGDTLTRIADATGSQGGFKNAQKKEQPKKAKKEQQQNKEQTKEGWDRHGNYIITKKGMEERQKQLDSNKNEEGEADPNKKRGLRKNKPFTPTSNKSGGKACSVVDKFKAKCGTKMKKHHQGGSLNGIPFMQQGTPKGGIEKSDNTRVQRVPNNGEGVYEMTPQGIGDFLPLVGTWRAAQRIDNREPNASYGDLAMNAAMDLLGVRMIGPVIKAASKANRIHKALKSRGFTQITKEPTHWARTPKYITTGLGDRLYSWQVPFTETAVKVIPNVDYANVAMQPLIQTLRVPATAPFK